MIGAATDEERNEETVGDNAQLASADVAAGLIRMGILPRIRFILEVSCWTNLIDGYRLPIDFRKDLNSSLVKEARRIWHACQAQAIVASQKKGARDLVELPFMKDSLRRIGKVT